jgi:hypothetical protein
MYRLKCKACGDYLEVEMPMQKLHQWNPKFEGVKKIDNYSALENGRCEKLPNPRYGREKYRLHIRKLKVYYVNVADTVACHSKCFFVSHNPFFFWKVFTFQIFSGLLIIIMSKLGRINDCPFWSFLEGCVVRGKCS